MRVQGLSVFGGFFVDGCGPGIDRLLNIDPPIFTMINISFDSLWIANTSGGRMREQLEQRLNLLKSELEAGQKTQAVLEAKLADLKASLLRISGAINVIEELLAENDQSNSSGG
jgi:hypothetical protein